jgi:prevent-host-death family protein
MSDGCSSVERVSARLEDWRIIDIGNGVCILAGRPYGRSGLRDGTWMTSSCVVQDRWTSCRHRIGQQVSLGVPYPADLDLPEAVGTVLLGKGMSGRNFLSLNEYEQAAPELTALCSPAKAATSKVIDGLRSVPHYYPSSVRLVRRQDMDPINLSDAKTHLSSLVDRAAAGEEIIIAKNGIPTAKLVPLPAQNQPRKPAGALGVTYIAPDFDALDLNTLALFEQED